MVFGWMWSLFVQLLWSHKANFATYYIKTTSRVKSESKICIVTLFIHTCNIASTSRSSAERLNDFVFVVKMAFDVKLVADDATTTLRLGCRPFSLTLIDHIFVHILWEPLNIITWESNYTFTVIRLYIFSPHT